MYNVFSILFVTIILNDLLAILGVKICWEKILALLAWTLLEIVEK